MTALLTATAFDRLETIAGHVVTELIGPLVKAREFATLQLIVQRGGLAAGVNGQERRVRDILALAADADPDAKTCVAACVAAASAAGGGVLGRALHTVVEHGLPPAALRVLLEAGADPAARLDRGQPIGAVGDLTHGTLLAMALRRYRNDSGTAEALRDETIRLLVGAPLTEVPEAGAFATQGALFNGLQERPMDLVEYAFLVSHHVRDAKGDALAFAAACLDHEAPDVRAAYGRELSRMLKSQDAVPRDFDNLRDTSNLLRIAVAAASADLAVGDATLASHCGFIGRIGAGPAVPMTGNILHILANSEYDEVSARAVANLARQRPDWLEASAVPRDAGGRATGKVKASLALAERGAATPLLMAAANAKPLLVQALLQAGADPLAHDRIALRKCADHAELRSALRAASARHTARQALTALSP